MMRTNWLTRLTLFVGTACVCYLGAVLCAEQPVDEAKKNKIDDKDRVALAVARDRAKLMHDIYAATLDVMHHRYFRGDRTIVPARAMEDVFAEIKRQSKSDARWIAVNMQAMSLDHEPATDFEKRAAREITTGKSELEVVEDGYYRRAGAIPLTSGCVSCHGGFFRDQSKSAKFAALVISVPITVEAN